MLGALGLRNALRRFRRRQSGASVTEYGLIVGIVVTASLGIAMAAGAIRVDFERIVCTVQGSCVPQAPIERLAFQDRIDVARATVIESNTVSLAFPSQPEALEVAVSGGDAQWRVDGGEWRSEAGEAANGQSLQLRVTSAAAFETDVTVDVTAGTVQGRWRVRTLANAYNEQPLFSLAFQDWLTAEPGQRVPSNIVVPVGFADPLEVSIQAADSAAEFRIGDGEWTASPAMLAPGQTLQLRQLSAVDLGVLRQMQIAVGPYVIQPWTVGTRETDEPEDTTLEELEFPAILGAEPNHWVVSKAVRLTMPQTIAAVLAGEPTAQIQVAGGDWVRGPVDIEPGIPFRLRLLSSPDWLGERAMTLTLGDKIAPWSVTVRGPDDAPGGLIFGAIGGADPGETYISDAAQAGSFDGPLALTVMENDLDAEIAKNGGPWSQSVTIVPGDIVQLQAKAPAGFATVGTVRIQAGSLTPQWTLYTREADRVPSGLAFRPLRDQLPGATVSSETLVLADFDPTLDAALTPQGSAAGGTLYVGDEAVIGTVPLSPGARVRVEAVVPGIGQTACYRLTVGAGAADWCVSAAEPFAFRSMGGIDPGLRVTSNSVGVPVSASPLTISIQNAPTAELVIDGTPTGQRSADVSEGQRVALQVDASEEFNSTVAVTATMGPESATWQVATRQPQEVVPAPDDVDTRFLFRPLRDVERSASVMSNIVAPELTAPTDLTLTGAGGVAVRLRAGSGADWGGWQAAPATVSVQPGDHVQLRMTASDRYFRTLVATATLAGEVARWVVSTQADPATGGASEGELGFAPLHNLSRDTRVSSNIVRLKLPAPATMSIVGEGNPAIRVQRGGGSWSAYAAPNVAVQDGDLVQLSATTANTPATLRLSDVSLNGDTVTWVYATADGAGDAISSVFRFDTVGDAPLGQTFMSNVVQFKLDGERSVSLTGEGNARMRVWRAGSWGDFVTGSALLQDGDRLQLTMDAPGQYATRRTATARIGDVTAPWSVVTLPVPQNGVGPTTFAGAFTPAIKVDPGAATGSNAVIFTGLTAPLALSLSGDSGASMVVDGVDRGRSASVSNGSVLRLQTVAPAGFETTAEMTVSAGSWGNAPWTVTTRARKTTPDPFAFASRLLQAVNSAQVSTVTVTGFEGTVPVTVTPDATYPGNPRISVNGGAYVAADSVPAPQVAAGQTVAISVTAPSVLEKTQVTGVQIGGRSGSYTVSTNYDAIPKAIAFGEALGQEPAVLARSQAVMLTEFTGSVAVSVSGGDARLNVNGVDSTGTTATLVPGDRLAVRITTPAQFGATVVANVTVAGLGVIPWSVTTRPAVTAPRGLVLTAVPTAEPSTRIGSLPVTLLSFDNSISLSVSGDGAPSLRINGGPWRQSASNILPRDVLELSADSADAFATTRTVVLTAGSGTFNWLVTTRPISRTPNFPAIARTFNAAPNTTVLSTAVTVTGFDGDLTATAVSQPGAMAVTPRLVVAGTEYQPGQSATIRAGQTIQAAVATPGFHDQDLGVVLRVGTVERVWTLRTGPDNQPNAIGFSARTGVEPGEDVTSSQALLCDFDTPLLVTLSVDRNAELPATLLVNGVAVGPQAQVNPGTGACSAETWPMLQVRMTALSDFNVQRQATVTVGPYVQAVWPVTTREARKLPGGLYFGAMRDVPVGQVVPSGTATLTAFDGALPLRVLPTGSGGSGLPQYRIETAAGTDSGWVDGATTSEVRNGDRVTLRMTASPSFGTERTVKITVGTASTTWRTRSVMQIATPAGLDFPAVSNLEPYDTAFSTAQTLGGITVPVTLSVIADGSGEPPAISTDGGETFSAGPVQAAAGDSLQLSVGAATGFDTVRRVTLTVVGEDASGPVTTTKIWTARTRLADTEADSFAFAPTSRTVDATAWAQSDPVTVTGFDIAVPAVLAVTPAAGGDAQIAVQTGAAGDWSGWAPSPAGAPVAVSPGDAVRIRVPASASYGQTRTATLTVGGRSASFAAVTKPLSAEAFGFAPTPGLMPNTTVESDPVVLAGWIGATVLAPQGSAAPRIAVMKPGGAWSAYATSQTVSAGDSVRLQAVSDSDYGIARTISLAVGTTVGTWRLTNRTPPDSVPDAFSFPATNNVAVGAGSLAQSQDALILGFDPAVRLTAFVAGPGAPALRRFNADTGWTAWSAGSIANIAPGDRLQIRSDAAPDYLISRVVTVTIGGTMATWTYTTQTGPNTVPDDFAFAATEGLALASLATSQPVTVLGIATGVPITVYGEGGPRIRINGRASIDPGTGGTLIYAGDTVAVEATTATGYTQARTATVAIGGKTAQWRFTTRGAPDLTPEALPALATGNLPPNTLQSSSQWTVSGIEPGFTVAVSLQGDGAPAFSINDSASWTPANSAGAPPLVGNGDRIRVRMTTSSAYSTARTATISVGGVVGRWTATTMAAPRTVPDGFTLGSMVDQPLNTLISAPATVTVSGLSEGTTVPASIVGDGAAAFQINGTGAWYYGNYAPAPLVGNGTVIAVRMTTAYSEATQRRAELTIGGVKATWTVTTLSQAHAGTLYAPSVDNAPVNAMVESAAFTVPASGTLTLNWIGNNDRPNLAQFIAVVSNGSVWTPSWQMASCSNQSYVEYCRVSLAVTAGQTLKLRTYTGVTYEARQTFQLSLGAMTTQWWVTSRAAPDLTPDPVNFANIDNAPLSSMVESEEVIVSGFEAGPKNEIVAMTLNWAGSNDRPGLNQNFAIVVNGVPMPASWAMSSCTSQSYDVSYCRATATLVPGARVKLRAYTDATYNIRQVFAYSIGGYTGNWYATTRSEPDLVPDPFTVTAVDNQALNATVDSPEFIMTGFENGPKGETVSMSLNWVNSSHRPNINRNFGILVDNVLTPASWPMSSCSNPTYDANYCRATVTVRPGSRIRIRTFTDETYGAQQRLRVTVGGYNTDWYVTTRNPPDLTPDPFKFKSADSAPFSSMVESEEITLTGFEPTLKSTEAVRLMMRWTNGSHRPNLPSNVAIVLNGAVQPASWAMSSCSNPSYWEYCSPVVTVTPGSKIKLRTYTDANAAQRQTFQLTIGSYMTEWHVTTRQALDTTPAGFIMNPAYDVTADTPVTSATVKLDGFETQIPLTLRMNRSFVPNLDRPVILTVGGQSAQFSQQGCYANPANCAVTLQIQPGQSFTVTTTTDTTVGAKQSFTVDANGVTGTWLVTTAAPM